MLHSMTLSPFRPGGSGSSSGSSAAVINSVNGKTGVVVLDADDIDDSNTGNKFATSDELTKLAGIEPGANVTDATNVAGSGAVMATSTITKLNGPITQAAYDALTPAADTLYVIVG